jgi:hypothetical protein
MTRLQSTSDAQGMIRSSYRIVNQRAVTASHIWILVRSMGLMTLDYAPSWSKIKSTHLLRPAAGITVGTSHRAIPIRKMHRSYPCVIPRYLCPILTEHRHTVITSHNLRGHLCPTHATLLYIAIFLRARARLSTTLLP